LQPIFVVFPVDRARMSIVVGHEHHHPNGRWDPLDPKIQNRHCS
jgi:hypothetical protein